VEKTLSNLVLIGVMLDNLGLGSRMGSQSPAARSRKESGKLKLVVAIWA